MLAPKEEEMTQAAGRDHNSNSKGGKQLLTLIPSGCALNNCYFNQFPCVLSAGLRPSKHGGKLNT